MLIPFGPPSTHWVVPRALFIKLVKRSCPVPVTDTLCWVSFSLAVGALYKLYYYYYYYCHIFNFQGFTIDISHRDETLPIHALTLEVFERHRGKENMMFYDIKSTFQGLTALPSHFRKVRMPSQVERRTRSWSLRPRPPFREKALRPTLHAGTTSGTLYRYVSSCAMWK